jgi:hypothetical protein
MRSNIVEVRAQYLVHIAIHWHFPVPPGALEREIMSKTVSDGRLKKDRPMIVENAPPLLSEKLIAQLQGAVSSALRKRMTAPAARSVDKKARFSSK